MILGCCPGRVAISFCECANTKLTYPGCETQDAAGEGQGLASSRLVLLTWQTPCPFQGRPVDISWGPEVSRMWAPAPRTRMFSAVPARQ